MARASLVTMTWIPPPAPGPGQGVSAALRLRRDMVCGRGVPGGFVSAARMAHLHTRDAETHAEDDCSIFG